VIAVDLDSLHATPATDPYAALVYAARADDVCFTMVNGVILYDRGRFPECEDVDAIRRQATALRQRGRAPSETP
jgi:cytosine/adenosine deaminase-related metal-dependent hydrolase